MDSQANSSVGFPPALAGDLRAQGWAEVELLESVDSTNAYALRAPRPWRLVAAHEQTSGRGRLTRTWEVPPGAAVTLSATLPLPGETRSWGWVPLCVGEATRRAVSSHLPSRRRASLKWPNDILIGDADGAAHKVAGILCQVAPEAGAVVVGVGVNVSQERSQLPVPDATSLWLEGSTASREQVLVSLAESLLGLGRSWSGGQIEAEWKQAVGEHCSTIGAFVDVHTPSGEVVRARCEGIDDEGRIVTVPVGDETARAGQSPAPGTKVAYSVADIVHVRMKR